MNLLLSVLVIVAAPSAEDAGRVRTISVDAKTTREPIPLRLSTTTSTTIKLNRPVAKGISIGMADDFLLEVLDGQSQINVKAKTSKVGLTTNLNVPTKTGEFVSFDVSTVEAKKADVFLSIEFVGPAPSVTKAEETMGPCSSECEEKMARSYLSGAADVLAVRSLGDRAVNWDVIFKVLTFVKIGNRGFIRFEIENRSRDTWVAGEVKLSFAVSGRDAKDVEVNHFFKQAVIERGATTSGAIGFDMYDLPENARFRIQAFEKNGTRHPEVTGVRL
ncbi:MAG: DUF2381 family protein [Deltaproteobacteria bacterium]|nr:DUF2381 family protein [Deltaproteobacteria bacterium]